MYKGSKNGGEGFSSTLCIDRQSGGNHHLIPVLSVCNYINKPTRYIFCIYLLYNLCTTLHVSNDHFVHHHEFIIYCNCTNHAKMSIDKECKINKYKKVYLVSLTWHCKVRVSFCYISIHISSPTRYTMWSQWISFIPHFLLARHVSDLFGPSSGAFCTSCIRRFGMW